MIIHKQGKQVAERYIGFGQYEEVKAPLCVGAKALWQGKSFYTHRNWQYVTCKHCLRKRPEQFPKKEECGERPHSSSRNFEIIGYAGI